MDWFQVEFHTRQNAAVLGAHGGHGVVGLGETGFLAEGDDDEGWPQVLTAKRDGGADQGAELTEGVTEGIEGAGGKLLLVFEAENDLLAGGGQNRRQR